MTVATTKTTGPARRVTLVVGALAGFVAAGVALGVTEFVDGLSDSVPSMVAVVGQVVIRLTPGDAARAGIEAVGAADKPLVLAGVVVLSLVAGAVAGWLAATRRWVGDCCFAVLGLVGILAAASTDGVPLAGATWAAIAAAIVGAVTLRSLLRAASADAADTALPTSTSPAARSFVTRRRFLVGSGAALAVAGVLAAGGRSLIGRSRGAVARAGLSLPAPADPATPAARELGLPGLDRWATPSDEFYRIDTALVVPQVDVEDWRLRIGGMVDRPLELSMDDLLARPMVERWVTLACVSNEVGGDLVGNARWLGIPLRELLEEAGVSSSADQVIGRAVDGFTAGFPLDAALDGRDTLLAVGMNGEPLPLEHGFPARLVVPGLYGYVSATKWLTEIELSRFDQFDAYWVRRGWAQQGPIKTQSRIDVPRPGQLSAGEQPVAGVAWAQGRGVERVEVRVDDGSWEDARIVESPTPDTWVQWVHTWNATGGEHAISVRATDGTGQRQPAERADPFPDGATGWHTIRVNVH